MTYLSAILSSSLGSSSLMSLSSTILSLEIATSSVSSVTTSSLTFFVWFPVSVSGKSDDESRLFTPTIDATRSAALKQNKRHSQNLNTRSLLTEHLNTSKIKEKVLVETVSKAFYL